MKFSYWNGLGKSIHMKSSVTGRMNWVLNKCNQIIQPQVKLSTGPKVEILMLDRCIIANMPIYPTLREVIELDLLDN